MNYHEVAATVAMSALRSKAVMLGVGIDVCEVSQQTYRFPGIFEVIRCAVEIQHGSNNEAALEVCRMQFRISVGRP